MNKIKKIAVTFFSVMFTLSMVGCSTEKTTGLKLSDGNEDFLSSDVLTLTNQTLFEKMLSTQNDYGINNGVEALTDLIDYDLLKDQFEVDQALIQDQLESYKDENFETFLVMNGFETEENFIHYLELSELRLMAARAAIEVTDEEVQEAYETLYEEEEEAPAFEEIKESLKENLINDKLTATFIEIKLAKLRYEAGFAILDPYLQAEYLSFLAAYEIEGEAVYEKTAKTDDSTVATVGERRYSTDILFDRLVSQSGLATAINFIDPLMLKENFEVEEETINEIIDNLKIQMGDQFYPMMAQYYGVSNDKEIRDLVELIQLQELAFLDRYTPTEERLKELYETYQPEISARHILVEEEALAEEIVAELEAAEDVEALFNELAQTHSIDVTASEGGDLGSFGADEAYAEEFMEEAFRLEVGEFTTKPVKTQHGYHVIYSYGKETETDFESVREKLEEKEINNLYTSTRLESVLFEHRETINLSFTMPQVQARYDAIKASVFEALAE